MSTLINDKNIKNTQILLLLDLSNPSKLIESLKIWLSSVKAIINEKISPEIIQEIIDNKKAKYDKQHFDIKNFIPCEMTVLFTKYESFETLDL